MRQIIQDCNSPIQQFIYLFIHFVNVLFIILFTFLIHSFSYLLIYLLTNSFVYSFFIDSFKMNHKKTQKYEPQSKLKNKTVLPAFILRDRLQFRF